jgi:hypothetical protein
MFYTFSLTFFREVLALDFAPATTKKGFAILHTPKEPVEALEGTSQNKWNCKICVVF